MSTCKHHVIHRKNLYEYTTFWCIDCHQEFMPIPKQLKGRCDCDQRGGLRIEEDGTAICGQCDKRLKTCRGCAVNNGCICPQEPEEKGKCQHPNMTPMMRACTKPCPDCCEPPSKEKCYPGETRCQECGIRGFMPSGKCPDGHPVEPVEPPAEEGSRPSDGLIKAYIERAIDIHERKDREKWEALLDFLSASPWNGTMEQDKLEDLRSKYL